MTYVRINELHLVPSNIKRTPTNSSSCWFAPNHHPIDEGRAEHNQAAWGSHERGVMGTVEIISLVTSDEGCERAANKVRASSEKPGGEVFQYWDLCESESSASCLK